jgi:deazaflavin-dependent oxidoreductase (nitroreductase family)
MSIAIIILVVAIPLSGMLLMRFRKRWLAKFNLAVTNRITSRFAGWLPIFGIVTHVGRKSGKVYRTPINAFRVPNGFAIALTYGPQAEWVKNVLAAEGCELETRGMRYRLVAPNIVHDPTRKQFPFPVRVILKLVGANDFIQLSIAEEK